MVFKKLLFCVFFAFYIQASLAQDFRNNYTPVRNYGPTKEFLKNVGVDFDSLRISESYKGRGERKEIKEAIKDSKKELLALDTASLLMRNDTLTKYLQALANKIQQKNSLLKGKKLTVFTFRTDEPNAANWGAGVILVNLDIISKFNSEAEMAFIMCHEIAHDIKGHVIHHMEERYRILHSEEFKKEIKKIKNQEYNAFKRYEALISRFLLKDTKNNRATELEADSLGLILFCNTGYPAFPSFSVMEKLDSSDKPAYTSKIDFLKHFNFKSCPFNKSWLIEETEESISGGNILDEIPDSLKTHPDCKIRSAALKRIAARQGYITKVSNTGNTYNYYKLLSYFELLEHNQSEYDVGAGLYNALQLSSMYPDNAYVKCSIVNCLYEIYVSRVDHYFSQVVDYPDKTNHPNYNELVIFLHNVNSDILKNILLNYNNTHVAGKINSPFSDYVQTLISSIDMPKKDRVKLIDQYKKKYSDTYYIALLTNKFKPKK